MTPEEFTKIIEKRLEQCLKTQKLKGEEYSRNGNRFHNFKVAARIKGETPEQALFGMYVKHLVSVMDMIEDVVLYGKVPSEEMLEEKIGDSIIYHLLLEGMFRERMQAKKKEDVRIKIDPPVEVIRGTLADLTRRQRESRRALQRLYDQMNAMNATLNELSEDQKTPRFGAVPVTISIRDEDDGHQD